MENAIVTTNMIYEFLKEFKLEVYNRFEQIDKRFEQVDKQFEQVDKRFEQVDKHFEQVEKRIDRIENQQLDARKMLMDIWQARNEDHKMLIDLWQSRDKVTINFSRTFTAVNAFISGIVATFIALFVKR